MTFRFCFLVLGFAVMAAMLLPAGPARADRIDGHWCADDGRRLTIDGPRILTPGGTQMEGSYDRHHFTYTVPATEPGAGTEIFMSQLNEQTIQFQAGQEAPVEIWRRCSQSIS